MTMIDLHGRKVSYLRLSVTDRCNLLCQYCAPIDQPRRAVRSLLSYDELYRLTRQSVLLGIVKIRITGGEPLVRPGIAPFLGRLCAIPGIDEVVLTTNGILLERMATSLRLAGISRLNVSLDSLRPTTFEAITGGGNLQRVLAGINAAERVGFPPARINVVVLRGINHEEIPSFVELAIHTGRVVRFIEYMPVHGTKTWDSWYVGSDEILELVELHHRLTPLERTEGFGPARYFSVDSGPAMIGVVSPVSKHFCASCNRIRISADGMAHGCLFSNEVVDLRPHLNGDDQAVRSILFTIIETKPLQHNLLNDPGAGVQISMAAVGG